VHQQFWYLTLSVTLRVEEQGGCFVLRDRNGQALSNVYFEDEPRHHLFTREEALHIARNLAKLRTFKTGLVATEVLVLPAPSASAELSAEGTNTSDLSLLAGLSGSFAVSFEAGQRQSGSRPAKVACP
jgi:hypothetical protein